MGLSEKDTLLGIAPRLRDDVDVRTLSLSSQEGFILSQIDGGTPAGILGDVVAMDGTAIIAALEHLESLGVIKWASARGVSPKLKKAVPAAAPVVSEHGDPALREVCDLTTDEKLRVLRVDSVFPSLSHWEVLGLSGSPTAIDIKRAYFAASKAFHPDRYFGRNLGSFRERLERIFKRLKIAHDILADPEQREAYRAKTPPPAMLTTLADLSAPYAVEVKPAAPPESPAEKAARLEKRRQEILDERRTKRWERHFKPKLADLEAKKKTANEMYQFGVTQMRAGQVFAAAASFKMALTYDQSNAQYSAMFTEATSRAQEARAQELAKDAEKAVAAGSSAKAAADFARAFEMAPHRSELAVRAAEEFLNSGNTESALQYATQAVEAAPSRTEVHIVVASVCEKMGNYRAALEHLQAAERLDAKDAHVKKAIKRLTK